MMRLTRSRRTIAVAGGLIAAAAVALFFYFHKTSSQSTSERPDAAGAPSAERRARGGGMSGMGGGPVAVRLATVTHGTVNRGQQSLGTVVGKQTVQLKARVDGYLVGLHFKEGELVQSGQKLFQIDDRVYKIAVEQALAQLQKDEAQLANSEIDLQRMLAAADGVSKQQLDAQRALTKQLAAVVRADRAQLESAKLQLDFSTIRAPFSGRIGLRQVDLGTMVKGSDTNPLATLTQTQPIYVLFAVPADALAEVNRSLRSHQPPKVLWVDSTSKAPLAEGKLAAIDNQIDSSTNTVKIKAEFSNHEGRLFPNQFVTIQLKLEQVAGLSIPLTALQRGSSGTYTYVAVRADEGQKVETRPLTVLAQDADQAIVKGPLNEGDQVVIDGGDKLKNGSRIFVPGSGRYDKTPASKP